jgi:UDP-N-acetylmuramate dehydrogenase
MKVNAARYLEYDTEEALLQLLSKGNLSTPVLHIGSGSNLLFTKDFPGTILHSRIGGITCTAEDAQTVTLRVGAGVIWDDFVACCVCNSWYGAENLSLIPGEVGAAAVQNIGAYGAEFQQLAVSVETVNLAGVKRIYEAGECRYGYRESFFKTPEGKELFVTYVNLRLNKEGTVKGTQRHAEPREGMPVRRATLSDVRQEILCVRRKKLPDPVIYGNAGSFFVNPQVSEEKLEELRRSFPDMPYYPLPAHRVKIPAGWLIEQCGWKGKASGNAAVHDKQALVLINRGGASPEEVLHLAEAVRESVQQKFGIELMPEVNII